MEIFDIVTEEGIVIGQAPRSECHGNPALMHRVVHVCVWKSEGSLVLQLRHPDKDIQPNKWDLSVGGHLALGEAPETAARREAREELGIDTGTLKFLYRYVWRTPIESELVYTYSIVHNGPFIIDPGEISAIRPWSPQEINRALGSGKLTPNFEHEWRMINKLSPFNHC